MQFTVHGRVVTVFPAKGADGCEAPAVLPACVASVDVSRSETRGCEAPAVYLNTYGGEGESIYKALQAAGCKAHTLIAISSLKWDSDMCPWECPPIAEGDTPCTGGADEYLALLTGEIIPQAESITGRPAWRGIAGYSLGGLFALYALYKADVFTRAASMSGSLWYPRFVEWAVSNKMIKQPDCVYLSLGDKECAARNKFLRPVQERTQQYFEHLKSLGIDTTFCLNKGGHFVHGTERTAAGIEWIVRHSMTE